jgi:Putative transposase
MLFGAASRTLVKIAADPRHLGAEIGFLAVLHTWGQNLLDHPHLHCVVPGGGLSPDGSRWIGSGEDFFLPVRVLSRVFRGKFLARLREAYQAGELKLEGRLRPLADPVEFQRLVSECYRTEWVVYSKPPFGGPQQVLAYLARYTHRVAISNRRLVSLEDGKVTFRWKNYAANGRKETMTLSAVEFLRRFLLHLLPRGFVRIRHYGFLANRHRAAKLACIRQLLGASPPEPSPPPSEDSRPGIVEESAASDACPVCGVGKMQLVHEWPCPSRRQLLESPWPWDSS